MSAASASFYKPATSFTRPGITPKLEEADSLKPSNDQGPKDPANESTSYLVHADISQETKEWIEKATKVLESRNSEQQEANDSAREKRDQAKEDFEEAAKSVFVHNGKYSMNNADARRLALSRKNSEAILKTLKYHVDRVERNLAMDARKDLVDATAAEYFRVIEKAKKLEDMSEKERKEIDPDDAVGQLAASAKAITAEYEIENTSKAKAPSATPAPSAKTGGSAKSGATNSSPAQTSPTQTSPAAPAGGASKTGEKPKQSPSNGKKKLMGQKLSKESAK
ncbi:hypothetical protein KC356_g1945 [Hortaea werneckii]|nr:hypothetical protein KC356_g1945 [Hortaea werneckii]